MLLLQVLARSSPTDKFNLVKLLKKQGDIVAVTGGFAPTTLHAQACTYELLFLHIIACSDLHFGACLHKLASISVLVQACAFKLACFGHKPHMWLRSAVFEDSKHDMPSSRQMPSCCEGTVVKQHNIILVL